MPPVREKAREYLGTHGSYRQVIRHKGTPILYDDRQAGNVPAGKDLAPGLAASTVWRWLSWLGSLENMRREARQLIRQKASGSVLHRETWPLRAWKYRSEARRQSLQRSAEMLVIESLFRDLFDQEVFPNFATAHGWS
jgi:hypothetical protein